MQALAKRQSAIGRGIAAARRVIGARYASYTPGGKFWLTIGAAALIVDVAIGFLAGFSQATFWHGVGFAMLAAGFAFLPDAAYEEFEAGRYLTAIVVAFLCIPIGIKAFEQQVTYSAGMRHGEIQLTQIVNARHTGAQQAVEETRTNYKLFQEHLKALQDERSALLAQHPWVTTVTADALREQVKTLDEKIAAEIAGGRGGRAKGCKAECEKLKDERNKVLGQISAAENLTGIDAKIAKLNTQIAGTKAVLDKERTKADTAEHRDSLNLSVAQFTAQIVNIARGASPADAVNADEIAVRYATLGSAGLGSFALLVLAPIGFFLAGRRRKDEDEAPAAGHKPTPLIRSAADQFPPKQSHVMVSLRSLAA